jgi:predicted acetyltransferase
VSDVEVRSITDDEIGAYLRCLGTGFLFGNDVNDEQLDFARFYMNDLTRRFGAFVDGSLCGTTGSFGTSLTVPGGQTAPMAAVTQVTVLPTHRRQGLLREMMQTQLADAVARGETIAMLIAAEWPIYGRFGYGMAVEAAGTVIDAGAAEFLDPTMRGSVEVVDLATLRDLAPEPFDRHRLMTPGAITRESVAWDLRLDVRSRPGDTPPKSRFRVVHRDERGVVDGYAVYDAGDEWVHNQPQMKVNVQELIAVTHDAFADLVRFLCAIDWVTGVRLNVRAIDEDVRPLFVNGRVARQVDRSDNMWVRLLDVPAALATRRYDVPISIVLDVDDDTLGGGRFRLEGDAESATCAPTDDAADVALGVDVVGAMYLGGSPVAPYVTAGRVTELTTGALARLDRSMRGVRAPWATTGF